MLWAMNEAPVDNPTEVVVLVALGDNAREDGTGACPGVKKIAARGRIAERTAQRTLRELEKRGVIRLGDQSIAAYLGRYAPVVYDLAMELRREDLADGVDLYDGGPERQQAVDNQGRQSVTPGPDRPAEGRQSVTPESVRGDRSADRGVTAVSPEPRPLTGSMAEVGGQVPGARVAEVLPPTRDEFGPTSPRCVQHVGAAGDPPCHSCRTARQEFEVAEGLRARAAATRETRELLDEQNRSRGSRSQGTARRAVETARAARRAARATNDEARGAQSPCERPEGAGEARTLTNGSQAVQGGTEREPVLL